MAGISYLGAGVSCLPFVGPFVSVYNSWKVNKELPSDPLIKDPINLADLQASTSSLKGKARKIQAAQEKVQAHKKTLQGGIIKSCV